MRSILVIILIILAISGCLFQDSPEDSYYDDRTVYWMNCSYRDTDDGGQYLEVELTFIKGYDCKDTDHDLITKSDTSKAYYKELDQIKYVKASFSADGVNSTYLGTYKNYECFDGISKCVLKDESSSDEVAIAYDSDRTALLGRLSNGRSFEMQCSETQTKQETDISTCDLNIVIDEVIEPQAVKPARSGNYVGVCIKEDIVKRVQTPNYPYHDTYGSLDDFIKTCLERNKGRFDELENVCHYEELIEERTVTEIFEFFNLTYADATQICAENSGSMSQELPEDASSQDLNKGLAYYQQEYGISHGTIVYPDALNSGYYIHWTSP